MKKTLALLLVLIISNLTFSQNVPSYVPSTGLVAWYGFNGNAIDGSLNGNNGVVNGATLTVDRYSKPNSAYNFNGTSDYITVADNNSLDFTNTFSISIWVKISEYANGNERVAIGKQRFADGTGYSVTAASAYSSSKYLGVVTNGSTQATVLPSDSLKLNQWENLTFIFGGGTISIFKNGILKGTSSSSGVVLINSSLPLFIGKEFSTSRFFKGQLDDIGLWNRALTLTEIQNLYYSCPASDTITTQPTNQVGTIGNSRNFSFSRLGTSINYQWQSSAANLGWQNVPNTNQYNGATTNSLTINNLNVSNHNQLFRVVSGRTGCNADTSISVKLTISNIALDSVRMLRLANDSARLTLDSINSLVRINKLIQDSSILSARIIMLSNDSIFYIGRINKLLSDSIIYVGRISSLQADSTNKNNTITNLNQEITSKNNTISLLQNDTTTKGNTIRSLQLALDNKHDTVYVSSVITSDTLRITITTGLSSNSSVINGISVYPNPATSILYLDLKNPGYYTATMTGVIGQAIITPTSGTIDISGLANGVYILSIYDKDNKLVSTNKVMIMR